MYPQDNPEKQAPKPRAEVDHQPETGKTAGTDRPEDTQIFRDWASI